MFGIDIKFKNNKGQLNNCKVYKGTGRTSKILTNGSDISLRMCNSKYEFVRINNDVIETNILIDDIEDFSIHELNE